MLTKRLHELRTERNISMSELGRHLGISQSGYSGYENGYRLPNIPMLKKLSEFYGVSVDYLIGLTDDRDIKKVESNIKEYLSKGNLNFDGKPVNDKELKPIKDLLEVVTFERLPKQINNKEKQKNIPQ